MYEDLGSYSGLVEEADRRAGGLWPAASPGARTRAAIRDALGFANDGGPAAPTVTVDSRWTDGELDCEELSWQLPYGPPSRAWLYRPRGAEALPGIVAFHCHGRFKFYGKEKIADGPLGTAPGLERYRDGYGGRAFVNALAREGFVVLVHDVFMWGSRKFDYDSMPENVRARGEAYAAGQRAAFRPAAMWDVYNTAAIEHEATVSKYCGILGTSIAGIVGYEDKVALEYLRSRSDVRSDAIGMIGHSGGGARVALAAALCDNVQAAVIVSQMSTQRELLGEIVEPHTWMFFPPGLSRIADWPDMAASAAPMPLLVLNGERDQMYTAAGRCAADEVIAARYAEAGSSNYSSRAYDVVHSFGLEMQRDAFAWLGERLRV